MARAGTPQRLSTYDADRRDPVPEHRLAQHPMRARRRPGPPGAEARPQPEQDLEDASRVLELIENGTLPKDGPPALAIPCDANGKPRRRLTPEDEVELGYRIQTWGDLEARNALVLANLGLVHLVANQMRRNGIRYDDLVQEGTLGLLRATETFEPHRGIRFSTREDPALPAAPRSRRHAVHRRRRDGDPAGWPSSSSSRSRGVPRRAHRRLRR
jgi:hypothetical protein